ncbi:MAG: alpha/beta hydrolase [Chloroflexi bacterium]|nr:alpha/beta hydrolase [Chloroflexota bacterium]
MASPCWKRKRTWLLLASALLVLAAAGFVAWATIIPAPMPEALAALQSDAQVSVSSSPWLVFRPAGRAPDTGLILYPGGRVDPRAYAPTARAIAAEGYLVAVVPMPLNLAVLGIGRASGVINAFPEVQRWAIGGHSLGGAMAASFVRRHPDRVAGLVLWASYPSSSGDLSTSALRVISISGTRDGLSTPDKIQGSRALLPATTLWVAIEGGNHAQFGWYGLQAGDGEATVSRQEQQAQVVQATVELLRSMP